MLYYNKPEVKEDNQKMRNLKPDSSASLTQNQNEEDEELMQGSPKLSPRQWELVALIVIYSKGNREIADELGLTTGTVKVYITRLFNKLRLPKRNRKTLALWWDSQCATVKNRRGDV